MTIASVKEFMEVSDLGLLNQMLAPASMRAGWNKAEPSLWPEPRTAFKVAHWEWERVRAALDAAGRLIDTEQAERRNLFMVNPHEGNFYATVRTLVSAYQMILPGERARSHRHTPNALRLTLDVGDNCYTVVDGVRIDMKPGDVLLTPGWAWHGHANEGASPGYWVDYLDVPLVQLLEPMFLELWPEGFQTPTSASRNGPFVFPWSDTQAKLSAVRPDPDDRRRIELGSPALPTMSLVMEALSAGQSTGNLRDTVNRIITVVEGSGESVIDGQTVKWARGDTMTVPSWKSHRHQASADAVLFEVSDRPAVEKLGFLRVERT